MTAQRLTDDRIAADLRAHLPVANASLRALILDEITTTQQERRLPWILGSLTEADPMARRRMMLLVALVALALAVSVAAMAGALLRERRAPDLSFDPPADLPAFVRAAYDDMPELQPMTITALRDGTTKIRIYVDVSGAVRIDEFAPIDATEPTRSQIFTGTTRAELAEIDSRRVWYEQAGAISEDPRVFVFASLGAARGVPAPGCEVAVSPGEEYSGAPARGWRYVALEYVADRPAHHVSCGDDLWIDVATRLTLRSRAAAAGSGDAPPQFGTVEVTSVELGQPPSGLFVIRQPDGVAAISPEEFQCLQIPACSATPAPVITPRPVQTEPATDGDAVVEAAKLAASELAGFEVVVEYSSAKFPKHSDRIIADGSGRFRIERWSEGWPERAIELIGPDYHYATEQLTDGTPVWRDRTGESRRGLPTYPLELPVDCDVGWAVIGVDEIGGRIADHVRCATAGSPDYWIDRKTHLAVRIFGTPDPAFGWEVSEVVQLRLGAQPSELFELPPDASLPPNPDAGDAVRGWPDTSENAAGVYSWDGTRCASESCVFGFMHNGYGSGDVAIRIEVVLGELPTDDDATAVTVAGHAGMYRRLDDGMEKWIVDIEGTTIAIRLDARPGTSPTDLAEAHAVIASMRAEPRDNRLGLRLVFTLATNDWDSG